MRNCECRDIDPRKFNWVLTIEYDSATTQDSFGAVPVKWAALPKNSTIWASIEQKSGHELLAAEQIRAEATAVVTTRYRSDLSPRNRFQVKGASPARTLEIVSMNDPDGSKRFLVFGCRETQ